MWKGGFDGVCMSQAQFGTYVAALRWNGWRPRFCVLHNTGAPTLKQWMATPGGEGQRVKNLAHYYRDQNKWSGGPHGFISPSGIFLGSPLTGPGTHTPSWNAISIGLEMAGDFDVEPFDPKVRDNAVSFLATVHAALGLQPEPFQLGVRGLHLHHEDPGTTHRHCPGRNVVKADMVKRIHDAMIAMHPGEHSPVVAHG